MTGKYLASAQAAGEVRELSGGGDGMMQDEGSSTRAEEDAGDAQ
jgi:hypothetical protein